MIATTSGSEIAKFSETFDGRILQMMGFGEAVAEVLRVCGAREKRRRKLEMQLIVALVVAMSLYRHLSIPAVFCEILNWQRGRVPDQPLKLVTDQALHHAKRRLGVDPMALLFHRLAARIEPKPTFHGHRTWGIDGVRMNMPDTVENEAVFGRPEASHGAKTAFPQMLAVALVSTDTHQVRDVIFNPYNAAERPCCEELIAPLGPEDLVLLDRGFHAAWLFEKFINQGVKFICRARTPIKTTLLKEFGVGDYLVEIEARIPIEPEECRGREENHRLKKFILRMIEYKIGTKEIVTLLTNLLDPVEFPARELALFYHERWECEITFDEIKTHLASVSGGTLELPLRSQSPQGVLQEAYGVFIAFNLVRELMAEAGARHNIPPRYISFVNSLQVIRMAMPRFESATIERVQPLWIQLLRDLADCKLDRPRRKRVYARVVRRKILRFPRKRPEHGQQLFDFRAELRLVRTQIHKSRAP